MRFRGAAIDMALLTELSKAELRRKSGQVVDYGDDACFSASAVCLPYNRECGHEIGLIVEAIRNMNAGPMIRVRNAAA